MPKIPPELGTPVSTREFSWDDMARRAWGTEFTLPDSAVYVFGGYIKKDSTDKGRTGIYGVNGSILNSEIQGFEQNTGDLFDPLQVDPGGFSLQFD